MQGIKKYDGIDTTSIYKERKKECQLQYGYGSRNHGNCYGKRNKNSVLEAVENGDLEAVKNYVEPRNEDINFLVVFREKELTPLMVASRKGQMDIVDLKAVGGGELDTTNTLGVTAIQRYLHRSSGSLGTTRTRPKFMALVHSSSQLSRRCIRWF